MIYTVSPYELLLAVKPRQMTCSNSYDLYSSSQSTVCNDANTPVHAASMHDGFSDAEKTPNQKRTHYITDIHAKHRLASQRTLYTQITIT